MNQILEEEKEYLKYVEKEIAREITKQEENMKEIPKKHNRPSQGDSFLVASLMTIAATKLRKLNASIKNPYFGRIDFLRDNEKEVVKIYIRKTTIVDETNKQVTTDWRSPICSLYYDGDIGHVSYAAPGGIENGELKLKRQIIIKDGEVIKVTDTNIVSNDELLAPYLSVNADNRIKTIIASIQKEQNSIIRMPITKNIIVQGVAGSGKTSVALHRIAYLVYNMSENITSNQILSLGPNKYFLDYVSSILPELETEPVDQKTYLELLNDLLKTKYALGSNEINNSKITKKIQAFKSSLIYQKLIYEFIQKYYQKGIVESGIIIDNTEVYSPEIINKYLFLKSNNAPNYELAYECILRDWKNNIENIYDKLNKKYRDIYITLPKGDPKREEAVAKSTNLNNLIKTDGVKIIKEYFKKITLKPIDIYEKFINSFDDVNLLSTNELIEFKTATISSLHKKKILFEDMPALIYINYLLKGANRQYKHIVIDEAQDYSLFHIDVLKKVYPDSTFSIYGDLGQSIYYHRGINDWETLSQDIFNNECEILYLNKSYRPTTEITEFANKILNSMNLHEANAVIRHGENIKCLDLATNINYKINRIKEFISKGYKTVAIICKTEKEANDVYKKISAAGLNITQITSRTEKYDGGIFVITCELAKGLEFDAVIINDASSKVYDEKSLNDMHLLYVASTRALHELEVLYDRQICSVFDDNINKIEISKMKVKLKNN